MERQVGLWFNAFRNPLSGRNNIGDDGERRIGDIVYAPAAIEVKQHKSVNMRNVECIKYPALAAKKPWALFEFKKGAINLVKLTTDHKTMKAICGFLDRYWRNGSKDEVKGE